MNLIISYLVSKLVGRKPENHKLAGEFVDQLVHHRVVPLGGVSEGSHIHHQNHLPLILLEVNFFSFQSFRRKLQKIVNSDRALDACHCLNRYSVLENKSRAVKDIWLEGLFCPIVPVCMPTVYALKWHSAENRSIYDYTGIRFFCTKGHISKS